MDLMAGQALRQFCKEITRALQDRGLFQSAHPRVPPAKHPITPEKHDPFFETELAVQQRRRRKLARQQLA